ncbi:hypothetical protein [Streptomyces sp. RKAG293]|uniref:hypothetical protein n=1 Tax=Streptomyces sp. RKAG293 TaxID=2893403 RepID=UPI0020345FDF|nr:hypothetical protein [Streptomyces sp. RKAG293]MCM2423605.1 hypothetical protein [Streptomyces sp. RKAG293]
MELDRLLPAYDFRSCFTRRIAADPATVWRALLDVTVEELPLSRRLVLLRSGGRIRLEGPLLATFPMPTLSTVEGAELVKGKVAKFWRLRPESAPIEPGDADAFTRFAEPGWGKAAMSLRVVPDGDTTVVSFETRVQATDARSRRVFRPYWLLIRLGGAAFIRIEVLRAVARRAERAAADAGETGETA